MLCSLLLLLIFFLILFLPSYVSPLRLSACTDFRNTSSCKRDISSLTFDNPEDELLELDDSMLLVTEKEETVPEFILSTVEFESQESMLLMELDESLF